MAAGAGGAPQLELQRAVIVAPDQKLMARGTERTGTRASLQALEKAAMFLHGRKPPAARARREDGDFPQRRGEIPASIDSLAAESVDALAMEPGALQEFARARRSVSLVLSSVILAVYFGFILAAAFAKGFMAETPVPGLSWGIFLGALVIVLAFALTGIYVRLTNRLDAALHQPPSGEKEQA